jgi:hypothetical protein
MECPGFYRASFEEPFSEHSNALKRWWRRETKEAKPELGSFSS